jgi:methyl-galactoside transport system substrate-binding protein
MKKRLIPLFTLAAVGLMAVSCTGGSNVNTKSTVFYNRQPSDANGIQTDVMTHTDNTFYAGFDAKAGGTTQGKMISDYVKAHAADLLDTGSTDTISYVLAIGQNSHNDSMARTIGIRTALGTLDTTAKTDTDKADPDKKKEGSITATDGKTYKVVERAAKEMRDSSGPWSSTVAGDTYAGWKTQFAGKIGFVVSNNDGMAEGMVGQMGEDKKPTFGYDANASTLAIIKAGGAIKGTISQNHHAQVLTCLQLTRNMVDGLTGADIYKKGFTEKDAYGNKIASANVAYTASDKSMLAENAIIDSTNVDAAIADTLDTGIKQTTATSKKILWTVYSNTDNFLNQSFIPTAKKYAKLYNFEITYIYGDGTQESSILDKFNDLGSYDGYVINMVETSSGALYQEKLDKAA